MAVSAPQIPSIPAGEHVQMNLPRIGLLPATVESSKPGELVAVLAVGDDRVKRLEGAEVAVEYATGRGINRFAGILHLDGKRPELLRIVLSGDAERIQRREWARIEATLKVRVSGIDEDIGGETVTLNISGGGVLVKDPWRDAARHRRPHRARGRGRRRADQGDGPRRARAGGRPEGHPHREHRPR